MLLYYCSIPVYRYRTCNVYVCKFFRTQFRFGTRCYIWRWDIKCLTETTFKRRKKLILLCMSSPQREPYSLVVLFFKRLLHCQQGNTKYSFMRRILYIHDCNVTSFLVPDKTLKKFV